MDFILFCFVFKFSEFHSHFLRDRPQGELIIATIDQCTCWGLKPESINYPYPFFMTSLVRWFVSGFLQSYKTKLVRKISKTPFDGGVACLALGCFPRHLSFKHTFQSIEQLVPKTPPTNLATHTWKNNAYILIKFYGYKTHRNSRAPATVWRKSS